MIRPLNTFLLGAIAMGCLVAGIFFHRYWRRSRDRFFLFFALSFWIEAANRLALALSPRPNEGHWGLYLVRLLSYLLILAAIADKNWRRTAP